jgi:MFS family permease
MMQLSTQPVAVSRGKANLALATLFVGMFVLGSGELLVVGLLNLIADDLQVSIPVAGVLVTAYALGLAIGGPVLTALTIKLNKRTILIGTVILVIVCTLAPMLTTSFGLFVAARTVIGALHGLFVAVGFVLAMSIVPPERMGRAISVVVSGLFVSTALGVPLGTLVGQVLGWRGSFTAVAVLSVVALIATLLLIPSMPGSGGGAGSQAKHAFAPRVLAALAVNVVAFAAVYSALTYIVPFLESVTGISGALISLFLLAYGVATAVRRPERRALPDRRHRRCSGLPAGALPCRHDRRARGAGAAGFRLVRHGHGALDAIPRGEPGRPRWTAGVLAARLRGQRRHRAGLVRRWRGDQHLHRLGCGDHRPDHCGDLHPDRLGHQLPEAAGNRGHDRARSGNSVTTEPAQSSEKINHLEDTHEWIAAGGQERCDLWRRGRHRRRHRPGIRPGRREGLHRRADAGEARRRGA